MENITLFQFFHWYYPSDGSLWKFATAQAGFLKKLGVTHVWLPPATKSANGMYEPGYAVYDLFDLGEFDQKGSVPTKYGTKAEYLRCIKALQKKGVKVLADVVLNHKTGADEKELVKAKPVDYHNRNNIAEREEVVEAYTKFTFPGRKGKYSNFIWDWRCFTGFGLMSNEGERIYSIVNEYGEDWEDVLDDEFGNFDYLMGSDIEFRNEHVREELKYWGRWFLETTGVDGFRLDAVKHISPQFMKEWVGHMKEIKNDVFFVAEYLTNDVNKLLTWYHAVDDQVQLFDMVLHHNFYEAGNQEKYDLRKILDNTLIRHLPHRAISFVDNHDSQPGQVLQSFVEYWFKPLANAIILLREQGIPCVFFPSLYGAGYDEKKDGNNFRVELAPVPVLREMMMVRHHLAYGEQRDYFDHPHVVGWVRTGDNEKKHSGCAVVLSNGDDGFKDMDLGAGHANAIFIDITGSYPEKIHTNGEGKAYFKVKSRSVSVWIRSEAAKMIKV